MEKHRSYHKLHANGKKVTLIGSAKYYNQTGKYGRREMNFVVARKFVTRMTCFNIREIYFRSRSWCSRKAEYYPVD